MAGGYRADIAMHTDRAAKRRAVVVGATVGSALGGLILAGYAGWTALFSDIPQVSSLEQVWTANRAASLEVVDAEGNTLALRGPRYGRRVAVDELPAHVLQAFLAVEDARFFEHGGVDLWAVARALVENLGAGRTVQGGSTITQQLVKNVYLSPEQTFRRKAQEMVLAWQLDRKLTKSQILEVYLNRIYFGQNAYGIDAAAWRFFSKRPQQLTLAEAALLAGLPKAPGRLARDITASPAVQRRAVVLQRMVEAGFITQSAANAAAAQPVTPEVTPEPSEGELAYAIDMAVQEIGRLPGQVAPDRVVRLTINSHFQQLAVEAVQQTLGDGVAGADQAALIAMDRQGRILAIVGGRTYGESQFNRATQARRQPGSTFKPFVYAAALENGMTPNTVRVDRPVRFGSWRPRNFGGGYSGAMSLNAALTRSINTIAVQLAAEVGVDRLILTARRLGIDSPLPRNLTIALGSGEVTLMDMTRAYGTLANDGVRIDPFLIEQIDTTRGTLAFQRQTRPPVQVYEPLRARQMTAMLADVVAFGTGKRARLVDGREAAGKTGTSQNFRDAWFIGYTADIICGVWVGNDASRPMNGITGGTLPATIWSRFMNGAHEGMPLSPLPTLEELDRPDARTIASFYESLADLFAAAGGARLEPLKSPPANAAGAAPAPPDRAADAQPAPVAVAAQAGAAAQQPTSRAPAWNASGNVAAGR
jgi:penicillin-binding protein 1A